MADEMDKRLDHHEWRLDSLESMTTRHSETIAGLTQRMDAHHTEVMAKLEALGRDEARYEGAREERERQSLEASRKVKIVGVAIAAIGLLAALGYLGQRAEGAWLAIDHAVNPPIPVQYYARGIP